MDKSKMADKAKSRLTAKTPETTDIRVRPVRLSVDLDPSTHKRLKLHAVGRGLTTVDVVRAAIDQTLADSDD